MFGRRKVAVLVSEFLGTAILTLLILSVQRSTIGVPFFVALAAGLTYALMSFVLAPTSGALLNPALSVAAWTARKLSTINAILFIAVQMLGGWAAYGLYSYFVNQSLQPVGGHFTARILIAESIGTGIFAFGFAAALYQRLSPAVSASVNGLSYVVGVVGASSAAIGLLNPAVALGARAWVWGTYVLGPVVGAVIGYNLYGYLFAPDVAVARSAGAAAASSTTASSSTVVKPARKTTVKKTAVKKPAAKRKTTTKKK